MTSNGIYCPSGDFYIDPWKPVDRAVITHAHSDHARWGSRRYLASRQSEPLLRWRLGPNIDLETLDYGSQLCLGDVQLSLHPAGHILGSSQVRIARRGYIVVITGDYKRVADPTCQPFELVPCHGLITESTFALPIFHWQSDAVWRKEIAAWYATNQQLGKCSILYGYALGKSQRVLSILQTLWKADGIRDPIYIHGALANPTRIYREAGIELPPTRLVSESAKTTDWSQTMVLAVPSAHGTPWMRKFGNVSTAMASGWMQIRGNRRRRNFDRGFVISDHADWPDLLATIRDTGASEVWVTHGFSDLLSKYLTELGIDAHPLSTQFVGETLVEEEADVSRVVDDNL